MATATMGVRFSEEERSWITEYASFRGQSASSIIREAVFEMIEDELDRNAYNEALAEDDGITYASNEVAEMMGFDRV